MPTPVRSNNFCDVSLYLVLDPAFCRHHSPDKVLALALKSGTSMVQFRTKPATITPDDTAIKGYLQHCQQHHTPFIINDNPLLARDINADGCHLGSDDGSFHEARQLLGTEKIIGMTVRNQHDLSKAIENARLGLCDYISIGAIFPSRSKQHQDPSFLGIAGLHDFVCKFRSAVNADFPICAISGITAENLYEVMSTGVHGIAVIGSICGADDPLESTKVLRKALDGSSSNPSERT